jgi:hypothetical protein
MRRKPGFSPAWQGFGAIFCQKTFDFRGNP